MLLRNALRKVPDGVCVRLIASDPSTLRDIPTLCRFMQHRLVSTEDLGDRYEFVVAARGDS